MFFPYLKWTKRQIETEDISVLGLDRDHWQRALLRLVRICHCAQTLLFSSSKWYPFRWVLLQISWLPILFTSAQLPLLWDMLDAVALPLNSSFFESLWHRTQQASDSIMFNKQATNMSPAENHFNIIPICEWLWESSISVLMENTELCSHWRYHWYVDGHSIIQRVGETLVSVAALLDYLGLKKEAKLVHACTTNTFVAHSNPSELPSHHPPHSSVLVASVGERKWDTVGGLKENLLPVYDQPQVLSCSQGPTKLLQKAQAGRWELRQQGIR